MILVACGLQREAGLIARRGVIAIPGGGDPARLERELEAAIARGGVSAVLSSGLAGALDPVLRAGDVVLATLSQGETRGTDFIKLLLAVLPDALAGTITASDTIVASAEAKARLHAATGALAVDMESHIAARVAARNALPFAAIRAISDAADRTLPAAALVGMKPDGGMALGAVLASLARRPAQLPALIRTGIDAERAFRSLRRVHDVLGRAGIGGADDREFALDMR